MVKVVLIDDEPFHLIGMRSIIPWEQHGYLIVGEARSAAAGIELILSTSPDIALVDILMPGVDGLEMIRRLRDLPQPPAFIVLSCMNDIQRYKEAVSLGVSEYLQKELVTPETLLEALARAGASRHPAQQPESGKGAALSEQSSYSARAAYLDRLMCGSHADLSAAAQRLEQIGLLPRGRAYCAAAISLQNLYTADPPDAQLCASVLGICQEIFCMANGGFFFQTAGHRLAALLPQLDVGYITQLFDRVRCTAEQGLDCTVTMGLSACDTDVSALPARYAQALRAEQLRYYHGTGRLYHFPSITREVAAPEPAQDARTALTLREQLAQLHQSLLDTLPEPQRAKERLAAFVEYVRLLSGRSGALSPALLDAFSSAVAQCHSAETLDAATAQIGALLDTLESARAPSRADELIESVRAYVRDHISERILAPDIAAAIYISPSYLGHVFKQKMGVSLNDYIRTEKVQHAKHLLQSRSVSDVAADLGYSSTSYFVAMFREQTGMTPHKYKKTLSH